MKRIVLENFHTWDIDNDRRQRKKYLKALDALVAKMRSELLKQKDCVHFFHPFFSMENPRLTKRKFLSWMRLFVNRSPAIASGLMINELATRGLKRFDVHQFCAWVEPWVKPYHEGVGLVDGIYRQIKRNGGTIPDSKVIEYCKVLAKMLLFRTAGEILYEFKLQLNEAISTEEIHACTVASATMTGHDITRTYCILLERVVRRSPDLRVATVKELARIVCDVSIRRLSNNSRLTAQILIHMSWDHMRSRPYKRFILEYRKLLREHHREQRSAMRQDIRFGNFGKRRRTRKTPKVRD